MTTTLKTAQPVVAGDAATLQLQDSNAAYVADGLAQKAQIKKMTHASPDSAMAVITIVTLWRKWLPTTINYVGFDSSLTEDESIQKAINDVFVAQEKSQELAFLAPVISVQQEQANIAVTNAWDTLPKVADKWSGALPQLPNWVIIPDSLSQSLAKYMAPTPTSK